MRTVHPSYSGRIHNRQGRPQRHEQAGNLLAVLQGQAPADAALPRLALDTYQQYQASYRQTVLNTFKQAADILNRAYSTVTDIGTSMWIIDPAVNNGTSSIADCHHFQLRLDPQCLADRAVRHLQGLAPCPLRRPSAPT